MLHTCDCEIQNLRFITKTVQLYICYISYLRYNHASMDDARWTGFRSDIRMRDPSADIGAHFDMVNMYLHIPLRMQNMCVFSTSLRDTKRNYTALFSLYN